ncbi:MAG: hypothetical protein KA054_02910 [Candidatus Moranbacteria bacterium]|nr:hypothetical protein [Candidatus Moranbacteria bacterium]
MVWRDMVQGTNRGIWCTLVSVVAVPRVTMAGVISDAPSFASVLMKILTFVLSTVGIVAILALVISGLMYMLSAGDMNEIATAKKYTFASVIGVSIALAALIIVRQISSLLQ